MYTKSLYHQQCNANSREGVILGNRDMFKNARIGE